MLPINFENLSSEAPELAETLRAIDAWCLANQDLPVIDPRRLSHELDISGSKLAKSLIFLANHGLLQQVYRFEAPQGYLLPNDYQSYLDVPDELEDSRSNQSFHRWDGEVVPVFKSAKHLSQRYE